MKFPRCKICNGSPFREKFTNGLCENCKAAVGSNPSSAVIAREKAVREALVASLVRVA